jgi:hypothetical protein
VFIGFLWCPADVETGGRDHPVCCAIRIQRLYSDVFFVNDRKSATGYYMPVVCGSVIAMTMDVYGHLFQATMARSWPGQNETRSAECDKSGT